ncbi:hypothetical protein [Collimonas silvisoli]|uniref:hypothetical protein n=1 Tax=Collimonas silvisoli TaxID=2825884 RepID=UPI001B8C00FE|nr:hypothetical protein [Collimonas silvisoli]
MSDQTSAGHAERMFDRYRAAFYIQNVIRDCYSRIVFGTFEDSELVDLNEEIADIGMARVSALWDALL